jgi:CRISPR system Cascade subunit CasC
MNQGENPFVNKFIEFHILQSFPVSCLNRDDVGAPKSAIIGGVPRARVSSQCWKRQVRMQMHQQGQRIAERTKLLTEVMGKACIEEGATSEQATTCAKKVVDLFTDKVTDGKTDALVFVSDYEATIVAKEFQAKQFDASAVDSKKLVKLLKENVCTAYDGLDIALFGRMVAKTPDLNVEAACSFSHAISTHKVVSEIDFFTALDDLSKDQGSSHMGSLEFNSATYYRYVSLNLGQLWETLHGIDVPDAVKAFVKALYLAVPVARQHSQSGASFWDFARIYVRRGQRLQVPFEQPVTSENGGGYLKPSEEALVAYLDKKEAVSGSLFGLIKKIDFGEDEHLSIDGVIDQLVAVVEGA